MTREEALQKVRGILTDVYPADGFSEIEEIMSALEVQPCEDMERKIEKEYLFESLCEDLKKLQVENENLRNALEQEPCDNLKAVKSIINKEINLLEERILSEANKGRWVEVEKCQCAIENLEFIDEYIKSLPPVTPKQKTGHWIEHPHEAGENWDYSKYECSECHVWEEDDSDYCPNCGAKMESKDM